MFNPHNKYNFIAAILKGRMLSQEKYTHLENRNIVLLTLHTTQIHLSLLGISINKNTRNFGIHP